MTLPMTPRERILAALTYQKPDCLPVDVGSHRSSGISAIVYAQLKKDLGIRGGDIYVYDFIQQLAIIEPEVLDILGSDVIELGRAYCHAPEDWKDWVLPDGTACKIPAYIDVVKEGDDWFVLNSEGKKAGVQKSGCYYFEQLIYPLSERGLENDDFSDLEEKLPLSMWSAAATPGGHFDLEQRAEFEAFSEGAKRLRASTDRAILGIFGGSLFEIPQGLYTPEGYFLSMVSSPGKVMELSEKLCELHMKSLETYLAAVGDSIDIILFGDDLGANMGPMIDPAMYREYYKPFHKKMWTLVKELAPHLKIQLHCCGGIEPFLEDLIEAGLDMVNPVQINAETMDSRMLRDKYKGRFTFWGGGCNTQEILNRASPDEVEAHVREQLEIWKPYDGFVFQQVHNILNDVPVANIRRLFETLASVRQRMGCH